MLGDERLNFLGKSYGTYLGATYAGLFPDRVGRLVLDGAVDPKLTSAALNKGQAIGFEGALTAFVDDCLRRSGCPLPDGRAQALAAVERLLADIDRRPLDAERGRPLTQGLAMLGLAFGLYDKGFWSGLRQGLDEAMEGDGSTLLVFADLYASRDRSGRYQGNSMAAQYAVNCLDRAEGSDIAALRSTADGLEKEAPVFGAYLAWSSLPCGFWPVPVTAEPHAVRAEGAAADRGRRDHPRPGHAVRLGGGTRRPAGVGPAADVRGRRPHGLPRQPVHRPGRGPLLPRGEGPGRRDPLPIARGIGAAVDLLAVPRFAAAHAALAQSARATHS